MANPTSTPKEPIIEFPEEDEEYEPAAQGPSKKRRQITAEHKIYKCTEPGCTNSYASKSGLSGHLKKHQSEKDQTTTATQTKKLEAGKAQRKEAWKKLATTDLEKFLDMVEELASQVTQYRQIEQHNMAVRAKQAENSKAQAAAVAENVKKVVPKTLSSQMVYTNGGLKFKGKAISCSVPNVPVEAMQLLFSPIGVTSYGRIELTEEAFTQVFGHTPSKGLRYGASLEMHFPVKVTWNSSGNLHVSTSYMLQK
eukprot:Phypoly_transcript_14629.p1 GENE.Phypoly_transcript_14629~~Phypoly_transcript_14629.p1  ORF type:complete len:253 (-),score=54.83 Phypoly_transcript_14629:181-939(-)